MTKQVVPATLQVSLLDRKNPELLILVTSFLKKVSCYAINKEEMKTMNVADKLAPHLTTENPGKKILFVIKLFGNGVIFGCDLC